MCRNTFQDHPPQLHIKPLSVTSCFLGNREEVRENQHSQIIHEKNRGWQRTLRGQRMPGKIGPHSERSCYWYPAKDLMLVLWRGSFPFSLCKDIFSFIHSPLFSCLFFSSSFCFVSPFPQLLLFYCSIKNTD